MGLPPAIPALAGQPVPYLKAQLQAWQTGARKTGLRTNRRFPSSFHKLDLHPSSTDAQRDALVSGHDHDGHSILIRPLQVVAADARGEAHSDALMGSGEIGDATKKTGTSAPHGPSLNPCQRP
jgi:hypothetical protein